MLEQINNDLKQAMKDKDSFKVSVLRMLKSSIQLEQIAKKCELTDADIQSVIKKQVKIRKDSKEEYSSYGKEESVLSLDKEINILSTYLPEEMSESEIKEIIDKTILEIKPTGLKDMGKLMKSINDQLSEKNADMALVSKLVKEKLSK